jgi:ABC-2 type transport system permease protein
MIELLNIEFYKFRKNSVAIVLSILFVLFLPFILLTVKDTFKNIPPPFPSSSVFYEFPTVWDYQGYVGNWLVSFLLGFMMIYFVTSEISNKTMRQCIINGWTRHQYWMSKFFVMLTLALVATMLYFISTLCIGIVHTADVDLELLLDNNGAVLRFFIMSLGYLSFAFLIATWIRKGILAILIYFCYILFLEQILRGVHLYYFKNKSVLYYPINIIEDLMPNPMFRAPDNWLSKDIGFKILLPYWQSGLLTILLTALFLGLSYRIVTKRDL